MPLTIGQTIHNRYRIDALLGQGGMGAVYRAWDTTLNISVAIKEMRPDPNADAHTLSQLRQQFKREAQVVAGLDHPNLVRVTDYFSWGGSECLVMNFVEGESLAKRIEREGAQPEAQVLAWARQLLDALAYCHARDVVHRDIKPQNVVITSEGKLVLVDFGLVKLWDPHNPRTQTVIRAMGTPEYAPPEQYSAFAGHTDPRSDLYSLGAMLYHLLVGRAPLSATDRMARPEQFTPLRKLAPGVSAEMEAVVLKAMALPLTERFASAQDMANALPGSSFADMTTKTSAKLPIWAWGLGGVGLLALLVGCLIGIVLVRRQAQKDGPTAVPTATPTVALAATSIASSPTATTPTPAPIPTSPSTPVPLSIVFDSDRPGHWEVYMMDERGANVVNLTNNLADDGDPAWSFDGRRIAFDTNRDGNWEIYTMNPDGTNVTRLTNHPDDDDSPAWSPDGSQVAFKSNRDGNWEIYVVNVNDQSVANLTNHSADDRLPAWSPDGQRIAYVSDRTGAWDIWLMNADGSDPINLTNHPDQDSFPAWSPEGQRIAFHSYREENAEIYVMNADGSGLTRLTDNPADDWGASWSPEGLRLAFTSDRNGNNDIYAMDANGSNVIRLTENEASDTWPVWSPTSR